MNGLLKFASLFLLLSIATYGVALQCYVCRYKWISQFNAVSGADCLGPNVNVSYLQTCPADKKYCKTQEIKNGFEGKVIQRSIARSCDSQASHLEFEAPNGGSTQLRSCQTDGCNTGNDAVRLQTAGHFFTLAATIIVTLASTTLAN